MNPFWTGFAYGAASCGFLWISLSVVAVCMIAKAKPVNEPVFTQEKIDSIKRRIEERKGKGNATY